MFGPDFSFLLKYLKNLQSDANQWGTMYKVDLSIVYKTVSVDQKLQPQKGPDQCQLPEREKEINYKNTFNLIILFQVYMISHT